jgi:PPOX class probable F420-dependent enzyme
MEVSEALDFIQNNKTGVLGTVGPDGAPHLVVIGVAVKDGTLLISTPRTTVKARNVRRDPRVSLVFGTRPWVGIAGRARIVADDLPPRLREYYRLAAGEHPDWDEFDQAMIDEQRVLIQVTPELAYPS